jgi:hypothetical protein
MRLRRIHCRRGPAAKDISLNGHGGEMLRIDASAMRALNAQVAHWVGNVAEMINGQALRNWADHLLVYESMR